MSYRVLTSLAAMAILGIACIPTEALAFVRAGGARVAGVHGVYRGGVYGGGVYRGAYVGRGVGIAAVGVGVGAAVTTLYRNGGGYCDPNYQDCGGGAYYSGGVVGSRYYSGGYYGGGAYYGGGVYRGGAVLRGGLVRGAHVGYHR